MNNSSPTTADLVDPDDPAFCDIIDAARQLVEFGFDPSDPDIARRAVEVGRRRHVGLPPPMDVVPVLPPPLSVVYYVRLGNRMKIGFTTNLLGRLSALQPEEVVAIEYGDRRLERARHTRFRDLRVIGEWFRYEGELVEHVEGLREITLSIDS